MKKLPQNFSLDKYGLKVRLINQNDADFILSLRANPHRTKYMITLEYNIKNQIKWIKEYKKREKEGLDYYFIYSSIKGKPIGVNRNSHIDLKTKSAKANSLIAVCGLKYEALKMELIRNEIVFDLLEMDTIWAEVHKRNSKAVRIFKLFGYKFKDSGTKFFHVSLTKDNFLKACKNSIIESLKNDTKIRI